MTLTKKSGYFPLKDGAQFAWMLEGDLKPEILGWVERSDRMMVKGTYGYWRTDDPQTAFGLACQSFGLEAT